MELTKTFSPQEYEDALESWHWLGLTGKTPILSSLFGDVFLMDGDGYWFLDSITGEVSKDWESEQELERSLSSAEGQERYLLGRLVASAGEGMVLAADEVYDLKHPPALGGSLEVTNVSVMSFVVALNISGQLHGQIHGLAPGTRVSGFTLVDAADRRASSGSSSKPKRRWSRR